MTRKEDIQDAIAEARRFIARAEAIRVYWWQDRALNEAASKRHTAKVTDKAAPQHAEAESGRAHSAMLRASLDLSAALARMRKGGR